MNIIAARQDSNRMIQRSLCNGETKEMVDVEESSRTRYLRCTTRMNSNSIRTLKTAIMKKSIPLLTWLGSLRDLNRKGCNLNTSEFSPSGLMLVLSCGSRKLDKRGRMMNGANLYTYIILLH
jgi:hypothetical protein